MFPKPNVIVVVGPTASGKTSLSIKIAKKFNGEVISADSRQVYKGLDLGTGKVTEDEMQGVPHHLLDICDPEETYTASDFVRDGRTAIKNILERTRLPIIAGGTFFYVDALLGKLVLPDVPPDPGLRAQLEEMSADSLYAALLKVDERRAADIDPGNKRRLIRALEVVAAIGKVPPAAVSENPYEFLIIGIDVSKEKLHENIHVRLLERIDKGMITEVEQLHNTGLSYERMDDIGLEYRFVAKYLQGLMTKEKMLEELETKIRQFAKRQMTWLKRNKDIHWFSPGDENAVFEAVEKFLQSTD